jgi:hypothetical protein
MLEEFVLADDVSDDLGENLIPVSDDVPPPDVPFQPKPTQTVLPAAPPGANDRADFADGSSQTTLPTGRREDGGFDFHGAETVIIDDTRHRLAREAPRRPAPPPQQAAPRRPPPPPPRPNRPSQPPPPSSEDRDEALHDAPTMIIDGARFRGRGR